MKISSLLSLALLCLSCTAQQDALDDGKFFSFDNQSADWVIVNYWAEWCAPCRKEIPELNELNDFQMKDGKVIKVYGVNFDLLGREDLKRVTEKMNIKFPNFLADPSFMSSSSRPEVLPTTFLFDGSGELIKEFLGPQTKEDLLETIPKELDYGS